MDFEGKRLVIASMHRKEQAMLTQFETELGVNCVVCEGLDTDYLGTFTGEKERFSDPVSTAREKCAKAAELINGDIYVASEGSFGPHPELLFAPIAEEILFFSVPTAGLEIVVKHLSMNTNFGHIETEDLAEAQRFAFCHKFPSHKLILSSCNSDARIFRKDIGTPDELKIAFESLNQIYPLVRVETDMRAMNNPTRMGEIGQATVKLIEKIKTCCPNCKRPGYGITERISGLPCGVCGTPTQSILRYKCECQDCGHSSFLEPEHKMSFEDPMYCQLCNP